jgi:hypothetical protein
MQRLGWPTRPRRISAIRSKRLDGLPRGEPFEHEADGFARQKDATVSLSDRHVPVPIGVSKVPEASGFVRGVAELVSSRDICEYGLIVQK